MQAIALILAAGKGTRMKSELIKVLHPILGKAMVMWPIHAAQEAGLKPCLVVGHQEEKVRTALATEDLLFARQAVPRGTGDAVLSAFDVLPKEGVVLVCCGDTPLLRTQTLSMLMDAHQGSLATVLTAKIDEPAAYGRIVRDEQGHVQEIVEASEATQEQLSIQEINTGCYVFDIAWLRTVLPTFQPHQPKNEIYLTDAIAHAAKEGKAKSLLLKDFDECQGVNDRWALAQASKILQQRVLKTHALAGVTFEDPDSNHVDASVRFEAEVVVERGAILRGKTEIGSHVRIGAYSVIENSFVREEVEILPHCHIVHSKIGSNTRIGPFARLREGTVLSQSCRIGNFVETKKSVLEKGAKVNHLSYVGDAHIGEDVNVGAGTITCNYDGFQKYKTVIENGAFIGSNSALVAPVRIGKGAIVGAGSTITQDVLSDSIAVVRPEQKTLEGAATRFRVRAKAKKERES